MIDQAIEGIKKIVNDTPLKYRLDAVQIHCIEQIIASYGLACLMDSKVAKEAERIVSADCATH